MAKPATIFHYGDTVKTNEGQGTIRYIGELPNKEGIFYGVDLTKGGGKNSGTVKDICYFKTKPKHGQFYRSSKLKLIKSGSETKYTIGDRVLCTKTNPATYGTIRYVGKPSFVASSNKIFYGIELEKENGNCDGTIKGVTYFSCKFKSKFGVYCRTDQVKPASKKLIKKDSKPPKKKLPPKSPKSEKKPPLNSNISKKISKKIDLEAKEIIEDDAKENANVNNSGNNEAMGTGGKAQFTKEEQEERQKWGKNTFLEVYSSSMQMWCPANIQQVMLASEQQPIDVFLVFYTNPQGEEFTKYLDRWSPFLRSSAVKLSPIPPQ